MMMIRIVTTCAEFKPRMGRMGIAGAVEDSLAVTIPEFKEVLVATGENQRTKGVDLS